MTKVHLFVLYETVNISRTQVKNAAWICVRSFKNCPANTEQLDKSAPWRSIPASQGTLLDLHGEAELNCTILAEGFMLKDISPYPCPALQEICNSFPVKQVLCSVHRSLDRWIFPGNQFIIKPLCLEVVAICKWHSAFLKVGGIYQADILLRNKLARDSLYSV